MLDSLRDGRARFREIFDAVNRARGASLPDARDTDTALRRVEPEAAGEGGAVSLEPLPAGTWVLAVGGYLSACMRFIAPTFEDGIAHLQSQGANVANAWVAGRCGTRHNAKIVRDAIDNLPMKPGERLIVVAHSKGVLDTLQMIADFPETAKRINALVSFASPITGSPLATDLPGWFRSLLVNLPLPTCGTGDKLALHDIEHDVRRRFMETFTMPVHIKTYCLAAWPTAGGISTAFRLMDKALTRQDPAHDGQVLVRDMALPGATLLAYLNGDHAAIAQPVNRNNSLVAKLASGLLRDHNAYPREVLMEAVVRNVLEGA